MTRPSGDECRSATLAACRAAAGRTPFHPARIAPPATPRALPRASPTRAASGPALHLTVEDREIGAYWLHLEAGPTATLEDLDLYLRRIWLECCGHLSAFQINGVRYAAVPDDEWGLEEE